MKILSTKTINEDEARDIVYTTWKETGVFPFNAGCDATEEVIERATIKEMEFEREEMIDDMAKEFEKFVDMNGSKYLYCEVYIYEKGIDVENYLMEIKNPKRCFKSVIDFEPSNFDEQITIYVDEITFKIVIEQRERESTAIILFTKQMKHDKY
ncbi:MAG: hypothetical protein KatS3mg096_643 [Candidatus Parcubacteria bacterium]|nr:MAG: hypothetical protein KatS3mg096_643 [Candidatus Parcubacteria bacterium]